MNLINGAQPCNVFWQVGSDATLGSASTFVGTILALGSISMNDGVITVYGRALARNGAVTLINDTITPSNCATDDAGAPGDGGSTADGGTSPGATTPGGSTIPAVVIAGITVIPAVPIGRPPGGPGSAGSSPAPGASSGPGNGTAMFTTNPRKVARGIAEFGITRCVEDTFKAAVTGLFIRKVVFKQDRRVIATRTKTPWQALVGAGAGVHWVTARVSFRDGTRPVTLKMRFKSCGEATRTANGKAPKLALKPAGFTG